jgi:hypothetical protein
MSLYLKNPMRILHRSAWGLVASLILFTLAAFCVAQNPNPSSTSSKKPTKHKTTKKINLDDFDFSGIDFSVFDWTTVGSTNDSTVSYNIKTVRRLNGNIVRAWIKNELKDDTPETRADYLRNRTAQSLRTFGYQNYSHTLELDEYNCTKGEGRVLSRVDYDAKGNVIDSTTSKNAEWTYVVPDSIGDSLFRALCRRK